MAKITCINCGYSQEIEDKRLILPYSYNCVMCGNKRKEAFDIYIDDGTWIQKGKKFSEITKEVVVKNENKITKWEYKMVYLSNTNIEQYLNNLGNQGWELVCSNFNATLLKRPKN